VSMRVTDFVLDPNDWRVAYAAAGRFHEAGLAKGGRGVLRTTDRGRTWTNVSAGLDNADVTSLAISPDGSHLFAGTSGGGVHRVPLPGH
jgi:hypothetical protein